MHNLSVCLRRTLRSIAYLASWRRYTQCQQLQQAASLAMSSFIIHCISSTALPVSRQDVRVLLSSHEKTVETNPVEKSHESLWTLLLTIKLSDRNVWVDVRLNYCRKWQRSRPTCTSNIPQFTGNNLHYYFELTSSSSSSSSSERLGGGSADLVRRECPRPTARSHSWQMKAAEPSPV